MLPTEDSNPDLENQNLMCSPITLAGKVAIPIVAQTKTPRNSGESRGV